MRKRVGIIGAGSSGLCAAKEMLAEGHEVVIFDRSSAIGGLWQRGDGASQRTALVLEETYSSSSALNTAYSDFPIQPEFGGSETYSISQAGYMKYLDAYVDSMGLKNYVQFNTDVVCVKRNEQTNKWVFLTKQQRKNKNQEEATTTTLEFDLVAVCSGQASIPKIPTIPGREHFKGNIRHSSELRNPDQIKMTYSNKRVLSVGGGESASDNARAVADAASHCDLSVRNAIAVLSRNLFGAHPDYSEHRTMLSCPPWLRWMTYKIQMTAKLPFGWAFAKVWNGEVFDLPSFFLVSKVLFTPKYLWESVTFKRSLCASIQATKTENFLYIINGDTSKLKPGIDLINEQGQVVFCDGRVAEYDEILLNTGFQSNKFPFLPVGFDDGVAHTRADRYLGMIHPQLPNMAFIGFVRGNVGSLVLGFEMQARWFALLASGKRELPPMCEMKKIIAKDCLEKDCYEYSRATWFYANYLARYHVKCEPNFLQFLAEHPIACLKAYCGAPTGYQYRMRGPHANPKAALEGYGLSNSAILHLNPTWFLNHPFWFVSGLACEYFWSRLPLVGPIFRPSLDSYH